MLGTKIREVRQQKGLTLNELAEKTDVTASYLSQLERNIIDPSLSSLRRIAVALEVPIYTFLDDTERQPVLITADKRQKLDLPNSAVTYEFLTPMAANKAFNPKMEIIFFQLNPEGSTSEELLTHAADECIYVIEGELEAYLGEDKYSLKAGDSIYITENTPHRFRNPGSGKTVGLSNICPPIY